MALPLLLALFYRCAGLTLQETEEVETANVSTRKFDLVWPSNQYVVGPQGGQWAHDNEASGMYYCDDLTSFILGCECHVYSQVRAIEVTCDAPDALSRMEAFANAHRLEMIEDTETHMVYQGDEEDLTYNITEQDLELLESPEGANNIAWHVDYLDGEGDDVFDMDYSGEGVHLFILDTGFDKHYERTDAFPDGVRLAPPEQHWHPEADEHDAFFDCNGHGTQVAFLAGGRFRSVAPNVTLHIARISTCPECTEPAKCGGGTSYSSYTFRAVNWVISTVKALNIKKAVVSRSFSTSSPDSATYKTYTMSAQALAENDILWVASAGNSNKTRCVEDYCKTKDKPCPNIGSYGGALYDETALIVGATKQSGQKASFSNWGGCVAQWMYGAGLKGVPPPSNNAAPASNSSAYDKYNLDGTSFAAPLAAGVAALFLEASEDIVATPDLKKAMVDSMIVEGSITSPPGNFSVSYDLDSISELSEKGDDTDDEIDKFYFCAPKDNRYYFSHCTFKNKETCIQAGASCVWKAVAATTCQARSTRYFAIYNVLCKTIPNACQRFSSFICVDTSLEPFY